MLASFYCAGVFFKARREWHLEKILKNQKSSALAIHSIHDKKVPIANADILLKDSNFKQVIKVETKGHNSCVKDDRFWDYVFHFIQVMKWMVVDEASVCINRISKKTSRSASFLRASNSSFFYYALIVT